MSNHDGRIDDLAHCTLTVGQLRRLLERFDDDAPVLVSSESGDYWSTTVAESIDEQDVGAASVTWSEYHEAYKLSASGQGVAIVIGPGEAIPVERPQQGVME